MERQDLVGKQALVIYEEHGKVLQCFASILALDDSFVSVKTEENILLIPARSIQKIKLRCGEDYGDGKVVSNAKN